MFAEFPLDGGGATSMATAGQVMLSMTGRAVRPMVTLTPAWLRAALSIPASAMLRATQAACAVFQGTKVVCGAGASEEMNKCTPEPLMAACSERQACATA